MTYDTIPIPHINLSDEPERIALNIFNQFFRGDYQIHYYEKTAKDSIQKKLYEQISKDDRIVILSFLINKTTEKLLTLPKSPNDLTQAHQEQQVKPMYTTLLHWFYRLIEQEGIIIPSDFFSKEDYVKAQAILTNIDRIIEELKSENPDKIEELTAVQEEVKKSKKFLWLGKDDWLKMTIGIIAKMAIDKGVLPLIGKVLSHFGVNMFLLN